MKKLCMNMLNDSKYIACITVLDYELLLSHSLKEIIFQSSLDDERHIVVDLALKSGLDKHRFVDFMVNKSGMIELNSFQYVNVDKVIENIANDILKGYEKIVHNSILSQSQIDRILN